MILVLAAHAGLLAQTRIMLVGNSITDGMESTDGFGFRNDIYDHLNSIGYPFLLVGSQKTWSDYPGHFKAGSDIGDFYLGTGGNGSFDIAPDMDLFAPHVLLIHIGTNDVDSGLPIAPYSQDRGATFLETLSGDLARMLAYILRWKTGSRGTDLERVYLSTIIPRTGYVNQVDQLNGEILNMVEDSEAGRIPGIPPGSLFLVDQFGGFDTITMMGPDGVHPNDTGYAWMGQVYFQALRLLPMFMIRISAESRSGVADQPVVDPLVVQVNDDYGTGVAGVLVTFRVIQGDAVVLGNETVPTDSSGQASGWIRLGSLGPVVVEASAQNLIEGEILFTATIREGAIVRGRVIYSSNGIPVSRVKISDAGYNMVEDTTDAAGFFQTPPFDLGRDLVLKAWKEPWEDVTDSVISSFDAALAARAVVGIENLNAWQRRAADVDGDGKLRMVDAAFIARRAVGVPLPERILVGEWLFYPDSLYYPVLDRDQSDQLLTGTIRGDVDASWGGTGQMVSWEAAGAEARIEPEGEEAVLILESRGGSSLAWDFVCEFDTGELDPVSVKAFHGSGECHLIWREEVPGRIRVGLYSLLPIKPGTAVARLRFRRLSGRSSDIVLGKLYIDGISRKTLTVQMPAGEVSRLPGEWALMPNFPNPFNGETRFTYQVPESRNVHLVILDLRGREVTVLKSGYHAAGTYQAVWNGKDSRGRDMASGGYFCRMRAGNISRTQKIQLLR